MAFFEVIIPEDLPPMRLEKYLLRALPVLPPWAVREAFSRHDVKVDGVRVKKDAAIKPGARVQVYGVYVEADDPLMVVYEDEQILLVNKPAGTSVLQDQGGGRTIAEMARLHVQKDNPNAMPPKPCHRLDNQTSGLLLLAKTDRAEELLLLAFRERSMKKTYTCLVRGTPNEREALLTAYLQKDAHAARVKVFDHPMADALPITTGYRVLEAGEVCRLKVDLVTGRTHQIRAHLAHIGHPILGDDAYGDRTFNREQHVKRLMLCATSLLFHGEDELAYLDGQSFAVLPPF